MGIYRLLLFDGYSSYLTREILKYIEDNNIISFCLFSHSSHLCQLLNIDVFQLFKYWYTEIINTAMR